MIDMTKGNNQPVVGSRAWHNMKELEQYERQHEADEMKKLQEHEAYWARKRAEQDAASENPSIDKYLAEQRKEQARINKTVNAIPTKLAGTTDQAMAAMNKQLMQQTFKR